MAIERKSTQFLLGVLLHVLFDCLSSCRHNFVANANDTNSNNRSSFLNTKRIRNSNINPSTITPSNGSNESEFKEKNEKISFATIDLSGQVNIHLSSPSHHDNEKLSTAPRSCPIFQIGNSKIIPSLFIKSNYDFRKKWYGITRTASVLSWHVAGRRINIEIEKSSLDLRIDKLQPGIELGDKSTSSFAVQRRMDGATVVSLHSELNKRVSLVANIAHSMTRVVKRFDSTSLITLIPHQDNSEGWIPQLQLGTTGVLTSKSEMGWTMSRKGKAFPMGARLSFSTKMYHTGRDEGNQPPKIRFEVMGHNSGSKGESVTSLVFQGELERLADTAHFTIVRKQNVMPNL